MSGLKVVALISGGKDSFFSILHCLANGHEVVALANLHPPLQDGEQSDDIDSFMYQTVGHSVIPLYEKALGLPVYRQAVLGSAVDSNKSYATPRHNDGQVTAAEDETESLLPLLLRVMAAHPEVKAISTGAILSDYQRTRVESVAMRLGLTPLSYLWQYPFLPPYSETSLLDDMAAIGQDSRIIKVASGGLDDSFLWENVSSVRTKGRLVKAMQRFGTLGDGAAVGEGGEFETLAVDGPWPIWKHSIQVDSDDRLVSMGDAGVVSLKLKNARLVAKDPADASVTAASVLERLRQPPMLDNKFAEIQSRIDTEHEASSEDLLQDANEKIDLEHTWTEQHTGNLITVSNCVGRGSGANAQMRDIMERLATDHNVQPSTIVFTTILLRNMSDFGGVNAAYGAGFTTPNPPARVTISCGDKLPKDVHVSLSVVALTGTAQQAKRGLHVQSRSYWAPANIGPYSQAISVPITSVHDSSGPLVVHVAGQIPLVPAIMDFSSADSLSPAAHFKQQAILSLQHLWRIGQIMSVKGWLGAVAFIDRSSEVSGSERARIAVQAWNHAHSPTDQNASGEEDDDEDVDLWEQTHGQYQSYGHSSGTLTERADIRNESIPPIFVAEVEELPKSAPIEWASVGSTALPQSMNTRGHITSKCMCQTMQASCNAESSITSCWVTLYDFPTSILSHTDLGLIDHTGNAYDGSYTIYTTQPVKSEVLPFPQATIIPCYRIWDAEGKPVSVIIAYRSA